MGLKRLMLLSCAATGTFIGMGSAALAQESGGGIGEVVVTAERREQTLQDVPVAVTAFTSETREQLNIISIEDFARVTPGVTYTNNDRMTVRGIGRLTNAIGTDGAVALFTDGHYSNSMQEATIRPMLVARTEILRGPSGTLYGRNSIAGAINVITRRPADEFEGEVTGSVGNYDGRALEGLVSGPLSDNLRFLVAGGLYQRGEGYINNIGPADDTGDMARTYVEAQLEADLTSNLNVRLRGFSWHWGDTYGVGNVLNQFTTPFSTSAVMDERLLYWNPTLNNQLNPTAPGVIDVTLNGPSADDYTNPGLADLNTIRTNRNAVGQLNDNLGVNFEATWDAGDFTLKYLGAWQNYDYFTTGIDFDGTDRVLSRTVFCGGPCVSSGVSTDMFGFYHEYQNWYSNEVNLSWSNDTLQWVGGLYQYHQEYFQDIGSGVVGDAAPGGFTVTNPAYRTGLATIGAAPANANGYLSNAGGEIVVDSYAAFSQVDWEMVPGLTATLGLRYSTDDKEGTDYARVISRSLLSAAFAPAGDVQNAYDITYALYCGGGGGAINPTLAACAATPGANRPTRINGNGALERDLSWDGSATTGTAGLQWEPNNDTNVYFRYSRGYKSGGWYGSSNLVGCSTTSCAGSPYTDPEEADNYELGAKLNLLDSVSLHAATYFINYEGAQAPLPVSTGFGTATRLINFDAEIRGFELEANWMPAEGVRLFANYAYNDSEIVGTRGQTYVDTRDPGATALGARPVGAAIPAGGFDFALQPQSLIGNVMPLSPEQKYSLGAILRWNTDLGSLTATGLYTHATQMQTTIFANPAYTIRGYEVADFRLVWANPDETFQLSAFVKNAFDESAFQARGPTPVNIVSGPVRDLSILNIPREFGVELRHRF